MGRGFDHPLAGSRADNTPNLPSGCDPEKQPKATQLVRTVVPRSESQNCRVSYTGGLSITRSTYADVRKSIQFDALRCFETSETVRYY